MDMKSKYAKKIILLALLLATVIIEAGWLLEPVDNSNLHREKVAQAVMDIARAAYQDCHMKNTGNQEACEPLRKKMVSETKRFVQIHFETHHD